MALANCDECGKELSEHAEVCPHCAASAKVALRTFEQERRKKVIIDHAVIEGEIRKALSKPEGDLTKGDLEQLTSLTLSDTPITDLTPLKDLTQLTYLKLSNNPRLDQEEIDDLWTMLSCSSESLFDIEIDSDYPDAGPKPKPWWKFW